MQLKKNTTGRNLIKVIFSALMNINFTVQYWNRKTFIKSFRDWSIEMKTAADGALADAARSKGNARCLLASYVSNL